MVMFPEQLQKLIDLAKENEFLEFREAGNHFDYSTAIASEGCRKLIAFYIPSRPRGVLIDHRGTYWVRARKA